MSSKLELKKAADSGIGQLAQGIRRILRAGDGSASIESILVRLTGALNRYSLSIDNQLELSKVDEKTAQLKVDEFNGEIGIKEAEFNVKIDSLLTQIREINASLETDLKLFAMEFRDKVPDSLKDVDAADVRKYLPFFIRDTFTDWLKKRSSF